MMGFWEWEETEGFLTRQTDMFKIRIDQGALGHQRPKPTTLLTNMEQIKELDGIAASGPGEEIHTDLERKLKQTATWSTWAPGLMAALKVVIPKFLSEQAPTSAEQVGSCGLEETSPSPTRAVQEGL